MPQVALLICIALVLLLLRVEQRAARSASMAVWIPAVWMMISASRPLTLWFGAGEKRVGPGNAAGSEVDRWTLIGLAVIGIIVLVRRRFDWPGAFRRNGWLLALLAYMFLSTLWSDITAIAMRRWMREIVVVVMAFCLISEANPREALESMLRRSAYILIPFSVLLIRYYGALGRAYGKFSGIEMWTGVTLQKNHLGRLCMIGILCMLPALYKRWRKPVLTPEDRQLAWADISVIVMALYLIRGSESATSLATLLLGLTIFGGMLLLRRLKISLPQPVLLAMVSILVAFGIATPFEGGTNVARFTGMLGRDETLTGRTEVWADSIGAWQQQPLLGYGTGSFWTDARRKRYDIPTAHNGYLDVLLEHGAVGLILTAAWLLSSTRRLYQGLSVHYVSASLAITFLLVSLVYNVTESAINDFTEEMTAVVAMASIVAGSKALSRKKRRRAPVASDVLLSSAATEELSDTWPGVRYSRIGYANRPLRSLQI